MDIALTPNQKQWLEDQVAAGSFASLEEAVSLAVAGLMTAPEDDDLGWAKLMVDEARASIARGEGVPVAVAKAESAELLRRLADR